MFLSVFPIVFHSCMDILNALFDCTPFPNEDALMLHPVEHTALVSFKSNAIENGKWWKGNPMENGLKQIKEKCDDIQKETEQTKL